MDKIKELMRTEAIAKLKAASATIAPLEDAFRCDKCSDRGVIKFEVPPDDRRYGKLYSCPNPDCPTVRERTRERFEKLKTLYRVDMDIETYQSYTFDTWRAQPPELIADKRIAFGVAQFFARNPFREFCMSDMLEDFNVKYTAEWIEDRQRLTFSLGKGHSDTLENSIGNWLVFEGDYGTGKTGLALSILRALPHDVFHLYVPLPQFIELFQATYQLKDDEERQHAQERLTRPIVDADVLMVDEMNVAVKENGGASEDKIRIVLNYIIQPRWLAKERKPTIITTNKPPDDFEKHWDRRITSRVFERAHWLRFQGVPLRRRNRPN